MRHDGNIAHRQQTPIYLTGSIARTKAGIQRLISFTKVSVLYKTSDRCIMQRAELSINHNRETPQLIRVVFMKRTSTESRYE